MGSVRDAWRDLGEISSVLTAAFLVAAVLVIAMVARRVLARVLRRVYARRIDVAAATQGGLGELARAKRHQTLATLLDSLLRYVVYGAALVVILAVLTPGAASAVFGASLLVVLVGFGLQRLLADVVAGALLLFEGHFAVGDVITVHPTDVTGTVEEFSLRTTTLRTLGDDRVTITNGSLLNVTRWSYGQRELRVSLLARGAEVEFRVGRAVAAAQVGDGSRWVRSPAVRSMVQAGDDLWSVELTVVIAPGQHALVEQFASQVSALLGDTLVGDIACIAVFAPAWERYRAGVLVRD